LSQSIVPRPLREFDLANHRRLGKRESDESGGCRHSLWVPAKSVSNYQNYELMRENPEIDAVYLVLPNAMHAEYTIRAAQAGKHVLCEKPMAVSSQSVTK
jgi:predicted dehydrogenase